MNIQPSIDLKKVNLQTAVGYLISLHENEYQWNLLGIRVVGVAATEEDIPTGEYEYGDAYEVGTKPPYDLYIYTRPDGKVHTEGYWFNTGKFPMPGPQGPKGDGWGTAQLFQEGITTNLTYDSANGGKNESISSMTYVDSTTGQRLTQSFQMVSRLPIIPGKYISMDATSDNKKMEVKVDDTTLAQDYIKIDKTKNSVIPQFWNGKIEWNTLTTGLGPNSVVQRAADSSTYLTKLYVNKIATTSNEYEVPTQAITYGGYSDGFTVEKTSTDTGTLTVGVLDAIKSYPNAGLKYDNQSYIRMDPTSAPDGTISFIHIDSIQNEDSGYKATGKCFSITVSTRAWQVVNIDFGGSTRTTHNLTITDSTTTTNIYFSLTNNRPETYEGAPAGLWSALENSPIACTVDNGGSYMAGMITIDGDNFKVFYGNGEELMMTQPQVSITDSLV